MKEINKKLKGLRDKIDKIDNKILELLDKRFRLATATLKFKKKVAAPNREKEIISLAIKKTNELSFVEPKFARKLISVIISESKRIQKLK